MVPLQLKVIQGEMGGVEVVGDGFRFFNMFPQSPPQKMSLSHTACPFNSLHFWLAWYPVIFTQVDTRFSFHVLKLAGR